MSHDHAIRALQAARDKIKDVTSKTANRTLEGAVQAVDSAVDDVVASWDALQERLAGEKDEPAGRRSAAMCLASKALAEDSVLRFLVGLLAGADPDVLRDHLANAGLLPGQRLDDYQDIIDHLARAREAIREAEKIAENLEEGE